MHPDICSTVSRLFYSGGLKTDKQTKELRLAAVPAGKACLWVHTPPRSDTHPHEKSKSYHNQTEAENILKFVRAQAEWLIGKTVMIMSFYKPQVCLLNDILRDTIAKLGLRARVVTVDASQGSEADVVLLSCVRSSGEFGFLKNKPRICVAISRAKEQIIVFGNRHMFQKNAIWAKIVRASNSY